MKLEFVAKRRQKEKELANANFALRLDNEPVTATGQASFPKALFGLAVIVAAGTLAELTVGHGIWVSEVGVETF